MVCETRNLLRSRALSVISQRFPSYREFDPLVPVWCVTPDRPGCIHRFFDTSPVSPSGRFIVVFQLPFEHRQPRPGEKGHIVVVDLGTGKDVFLAETSGWEPQMGANANWGASDEELFYNDVDVQVWQPFAWKVNPLTGDKQRLEGTVFHASNDGRWLISANLTTMRRTQSGYGVVVPDDYVRRNLGPVDDDGFYLTDTASGDCRLFVSIRSMLSQAQPKVEIEKPEYQEIYGFHSKFNPQGDVLMLSLRWYQKTRETLASKFKRRFSRSGKRRRRLDYAWVTVGLNDNQMHCAVGPEQWKKGGHHATWFPDGKQISMNLNLNGEGMRFVQVNADGSGLQEMVSGVVGTGHPTVHPDRRHLLTDTYLSESLAYGDGTVPLRWVDLETGREEVIARINVKQSTNNRVLRVDPHPAWDRSWRYIVFNGFVGGTRRVFIADMQGVLG